MIKERQLSRTESKIPENTGGFHDAINNVAYVVRDCQLFQHDLQTNITKPLRLKPFKEGIGRLLPNIPRFVSNPDTVKNGTGAYVSPSGLCVINADQSEDVLITNLGYSKGVHFWEFYCPVSLYGVSMGVARKQGITYKYEMFEFTSSTSRTVSFRLDLNAKKISAWVNKTIPVRLHSIVLTDGTWHPCIKLRGKGNPLIFNPFCTDPENVISPYNPFNTTVLSLDYPTIKPTPTVSLPPKYDEKLSLIALNDDQLCIYNINGLAKVFTRNERTRRFDFDSFELPTDANSLVELSFNINDINTVNAYLTKSGMPPLQSQRIIGMDIYIETTLQHWFDFLKYMIIYLQNNQGPLIVTQILLEKLESIRPYLYLLHEYIQPGLYSGYNRLAEWKKSKDHRYFDIFDYHFVTAVSDVTNFLPPTRLFDKEIVNPVIGFGKKYIAIANAGKINLFNTDIALHKLAELDTRWQFNKGKQLRKMDELAVNNLNEDREGPRIFKILANCMTSNKHEQPKKETKQIDPNAKFLKVLIEDFKFSQEDANEALIHTNNDSIDEAVAYITIKYAKDQPVQQNWLCRTCTLMNSSFVDACEACGDERTEQCEIAQEQRPQQIQQSPHIYHAVEMLSLVHTNNTLAPVLVCFRQDRKVRLWLVGPHPEHLNKFLFKEDYGFVSFTSFQYCEKANDLEIESVEYMDYFFGVIPENKWILLDETISELVGTDIAIAYTGTDIQLCSIQKQGFITKQPIKINFTSLYTDTPNIQIGDVNEEVYGHNAILVTKEALTTKELATIEDASIIMKDKLITNRKKKINKHAKIALNLEYLGVESNDVISAEVIINKSEVEADSQAAYISEAQSLASFQSKDKETQEQFIPLLVQQGPPGCNMSYPICSILYPASKSFLANYPYQVIFKHLHGKKLHVNSVIIERIGKNHNVKEIKEGLVWLSDHLNVAPSVRFKFKFSADSKRVVVKIPLSHPKKYLFILPIFEDGTDPNLPFEIGFVGATFRKELLATNDHHMEHFLGKHKLDTVILINQNGRTAQIEKQKVELMGPNTVRVLVDLPNDEPYRLEIKKPFRLIESSLIEEEPVQVAQDSPLTLIEKLLVPDNYRQLTDKLASQDLSQLDESNILKLLNRLILYGNKDASQSKNEFIGRIVKQLLQGSHGKYVQQVLLSYLNNASLKAIPSVDTLDLLLSLNLLSTAETEKLIGETLGEIKKERSPRYIHLRTQSRLPHLILESEFYSPYYFSQVQSTVVEHSEPIYNFPRLPLNFVIVKEKYIRTIMVDLDRQADIKYLLLCFEKSDLRTKMRIKVFRQDKELIYSTFYQDHCWLQLARNSYSKEMKKLFKDPLKSGLNCLGIELNTNARYLTIEISHTILPIIGEQSEIDNLPFIEIIPEVFGNYIQQESPIVARIAKYFLTPKETIHHVSKVNINNFGSYEKHAVNHHNREYHLYQGLNIKSEEGEFPSDNETAKKLMTKLLDEGDWDSLLKMHKAVAKKSTGHIGLDYHYTLIMKLLEKHPSALPESLAEELYKTLVVDEIGPVSVASLKAVLKHPRLFTGVLPYLYDELYNIFAEAKLPEKQVRQYIKTIVLSKQASMDKKAVYLLMKLLQSQPNAQDWLEQITLLGHESGHDEECGKILATCNWRERDFIKKYLINLSKSNSQLFTKLVFNLNSDSIARHLVDMLKIHTTQSVEYSNLLIPVVLKKLHEVKQPEVFESLAKQVLASLKKSDYHDNANGQLWSILLACSRCELSEKTQLQVLELLLNQSDEIKLEFIEIAEVAIKKHPDVTPNIIAGMVLQNNLYFSVASDAYLELLLKEKVVLEAGLLNVLTQVASQYLIKYCCVGGTEGTKCVTQSQLNVLNWGSKTLDLIIISSNDNLFETLKDFDVLDNMIGWYLLNNTEQLNPINPAYRTPSYDLIARIESKIMTILKGAGKHTAKLLKKIFQNFTKLNEQIKKAAWILESTRHIFAYRLHGGTNTLIKRLMEGHPELLASFVCESHFFDSLVKTLKDEKPLSSETINLGSEQELAAKFILDPNGEVKAQVKDWTLNKGGNSKSGLLNVKVNSPKLTLTAQQSICASSIIIGFLAVDTVEKNNIYPSTVSCWVGDNPSSLILLGTLDIIDDQNFSCSLTRVFGLNLNRLKFSPNKNHILNIFFNKGFKVIQFRMRRPQLTSLSDIFEGFQKSSDNGYYTVSFLSVNGYSEPTSPPSFVQTHLKLLSLLSQPNFKPALDFLIEKYFFKKHFPETVSAIAKWISVPQYTKLISDLFTAISENSKELGNQIIESFFRQSQRDAKTAVLIGNLISKNTRLAAQRLTKFYQYLLESLRMITATNSHEYAHYFDVFISSLEVSALNIHRLSLSNIELKLIHDDAENIFNLYIGLPAIRSRLIGFFTAIVMERPGVKTDKDILHKLVKYIWQKPNKSNYYPLFAPAIPTCPSVIAWFVSGGHLQKLIKEVIDDLNRNTPVINSINLLSSLSSCTIINEEINKSTSQLLVFKALSDTKTDKTLLKPVGRQAIAHFVSLFQRTCIDTPAEIEFSFMLKEILTDLPTKYSTEFIYQFLIPLVNSYKSVSVVLLPVDRSTNMYIDKPNRVINKCPIKANSERLEVQSKFPTRQVHKLSKVFSGVWHKIPKEQAVSNSFLGRGKVMYAEDSSGSNRLLLQLAEDGKLSTIINDKHEQHYMPEGFSSLKVGDYDIKGTDTDITISGFESPKIEFYGVDERSELNLLTNQLLFSMQRPSVLDSAFVRKESSKNYLTQQFVYDIPAQLKVSDLIKQINLAGLTLNKLALERFSLRLKGNGAADANSTLSDLSKSSSSGSILYLQYDAEGLFEYSSISSILKQDKDAKLDIVSTIGLFRSFEKQGGVEKIIEVVIESVSIWKNKEVAKKWLQYVQELKSFSSFPYFFSLYMKNKQNVELLFNLLAALPDKEQQQKWEPKEKQSVKELYRIVSEVFVVDNSSKIREFAMGNNFFEMMLQRLHLISKEAKRVLNVEEQPTEELPSLLVITKQTSEQEAKKRKTTKKKGVGYGNDSSSNQKWDVAETELTKKQMNEQILNIIGILDKFLDFQNWSPPKRLLESIYSSALLPIIQAALRGGSLLEIGKDSQVFKAYLHLIKTIAKHESLIPCLLNIPQTYTPRQTESVVDLLKQLEGTSKIFLSCLTVDTNEQNKASEEIAKEIVNTATIVDDAVQGYNINKGEDNAEIQRILELPLQQKYKHFMKDLRFDYISMKDNTGKFKHHYASSYSATYTPPVAKTIRLAQELADISTALPVEHTNAIYVRCDKERVDFMQALIMGSNGTPYGHGAYLFDIHFEDTYPSVSPKVNLTTTGHGKVRFNPNLYACGKVCLSLLGTWRGNATENWDPKVSTLLQVLVSIQSIIMAEQVYFNEPGFQHEQGTDEGDRKNEAYSNIVRYCNIKYAMSDNIRNPPKGFETVIRRHFYLKKDEILEECKTWVKYASKREASYTGLINDHNNNWCTQFKKSKTKYKEMLEEAIRELEQQLNKLPAPSPKDLIKVDKSPSKKKQIVGKTTDLDTANQLNLEQVDVTYGTDPQKSLQLDINDEKVKDRWSRYIGAMGIDAVNRQAKASVAVFGLGPFAIEVVKNIVLSGCRLITLIDDSPVTWNDLSGQFFLTETDIGKNRVESCLYKIQELNLYVKVDQMSLDLTDLSKLKDYTVIFVTELPYTDQIKLNNFCRDNKIKFISADCNGPYARLFNDFGSEFEVLDKNGEDPTEVMIESITNAERGMVTLLKGSKHPYQDGDVVTISKVDGMNSMKEGSTHPLINGTIHKIKVISSRSFEIGDTREYSEYLKNGLAKNVKIPVKLNFRSFENTILSKEDIPFDHNLVATDYTRLSHNNLLHFCFIALSKFRDNKKALPSQWSSDDANIFIDLYNTVDVSELTSEKERFVRLFSYTCEGSFPPLCAFFGGYASQEIVKAITSKYMPTNSLYYCDFDSVLPNMPQDLKDWQPVVDALQAQPKNNRNGGLRIVIGESLIKEIEKCRLFMIGSGAIGCELLKNYAMLNLGTAKADTATNTKQGMIILTDPDHIEVSNLNRQFLFREKHIRKPKSSTAAASVIQMNPNLKGHISARLDKISQATKDIFSDEFFRELTIVTNALDNIAARRYVDLRCIQNKIPLLESGTLGPKGHVQVIIPYKTETYGSKEDPAEDGEIPHCTLKMFPEETLHCVEWARDKFGSKFSLKPKALIKILQTKESDKPKSSDIKILRSSYKLLKNHPISFNGCIAYAIKKFYKYFRNDIKQLLYTYPLDAKTKDGQMFWRLPKRPPQPIEEFDPKNLLHCSFVSSLAVMVAKVYNISFPTNFRTESGKHQIGEFAATIPIEPFVPSDQKAKLIAQQLNKEKEKKLDVEDEAQQSPMLQDQTEEDLMNKIIALRQEMEPKISAEEFEKDCDENGHIDMIYAMSNLRAINYSLDPMDWITTKLKAGRIVPALSTTTTAIAGLQTYQLVKYLKKVKVGDMRNSFINLAVPIMQLSEPGEVEKIKLTEETIVTVWDRWDVPSTKNITIKQLFKTLEDKYKLKSRDLIYGSMPIYMAATMDIESKKTEKDALSTKPLKDLLNLDDGAQFVDITVTFSKLEGGELLKNTPPVRLIFEYEKEQNLSLIEEPLESLPATASAAANYNNDNNNESAYNSEEGDQLSNDSIE